jgi:pimeloyl-ACP methyl ester carboxylesterase
MRYRFGDHTLDTATLQLLDGAAEVELEPQVFSVLAHLIAHRDRVVAKEELLDEVWGSRFVSESALTTRIKQVRRAVGDTGRDQRVVRTLHGRGYRFVADVDVDADLGGGPATPAAAPGPSSPPPTHYAESLGASIAYQTFGRGPDVVLIAGYATNVETQWEHPLMAEFLTRLGRIARVTVLDKRGVGLSDRVPHDTALPLETRADDLIGVLDAAGIERATVLGSSEGGSLSVVFAASHPERVERLILHNTWVTGPDFLQHGGRDLDYVLEHWGSGRVYGRLGPSLATDDAGVQLMARYERQSATPRTARHLAELISQIDVAGVLEAVSVPTLVLHSSADPLVGSDHGRQLAAGIEDARLVIIDGADHYLLACDPIATVDAIAEFIVGPSSEERDGGERVLATVLAVDVGSSADLGFLAVAEREVEAGRGRVVRSGDDVVVATFDGPGRAVRAAVALRDAVSAIGIAVRAGVHTAEVQVDRDDVTGIGVDLAVRIAAMAEPGEVWVSRTVTDLVAGAGLRFEPRGDHQLEGIDQPWMLSAAIG